VDVFVIDAFADGPYTGNQAGVVLLTEARDANWMQRVAAELGHSETAFVGLVAPGPAGSPLPLRWFTPTTEVDLCGHATVAVAHVLGGDLRFETCSGVLGAGRGADGSIRLDCPGDPPEPVEAPHCMLACYWSTKLGRTELRGYQASTRGGTVGVAVHHDRVTLSGRAVTTLSGRLHHYERLRSRCVRSH
jgi:predicted PhzF superfamily epimerase YddE/YHI9